MVHVSYVPPRYAFLSTPPKFNSSPFKNGGWKTILSYWGPVTFQGRAVKLQVGNPFPSSQKPPTPNPQPTYGPKVDKDWTLALQLLQEKSFSVFMANLPPPEIRVFFHKALRETNGFS